MKRKFIMILAASTLILSACQTQQTAQATERATEESVLETTVSPEVEEVASERLNIRIPVPDTVYLIPLEQLASLNNVYEFYTMLDGEEILFPAIYAAFDISEDSKLELEEYIAGNMANLETQGFQAEDCGAVTLGNGEEYRKISASTGSLYQEFYMTPAEYDGEKVYAYISIACNDTEEEKKWAEEVLGGMTAY
ncbi:MAG: hypothetical protein PHV18_06525 [Lachnospiraceae bacterium]|nr:hypothetical protein [Lachnospiraceae bacterium]